MKIAVLGNVTVDFFAQDFKRAGHEVYLVPGFDGWRAAALDPTSGLHTFAPEAILLILDGGDEHGAAALLRAQFPRARVIVPDLALLAGETPNFWDERMRKLAAMPFSLRAVKAIEDEFAFQLLTAPKKILALDADNTLWKGIVSEDELASVIPYAEFQQGVLDLRARGVVLVLVSKNDPPGTGAPITQMFARSDVPLTLTDFAEVCVNWSPKAGNLLAACQRLNLSVDSVVFVDDNPHERAQMCAHLPMVTVPPFPEDLTHPAQFLRRLQQMFFSTVGITAEDRARATMYADEAARKDLAARMETLDDYLDSLKLVCTPTRATGEDVPRLAQMAGKTNQFNATTIRRTAEEITALIADPARRVWVFRVKDAFGDMGLVCYAIADVTTGHLTDFVMSCRAMGRTIEHFALNTVRAALAEEGRSLVAIDCVPTAKNGPFRSFLTTVDLTSAQPLRTHVACA